MRSTTELQFATVLADSPVFEDCYSFWKQSWERTFSELGVADHLPLLSDAFLYRTKNCLFFNGKPVAIYLTEEISSRGPWRDHSYFQMYSAEFQSQVFRVYDRMLAVSYIAISEMWRKSKTDIPILDLVFGLAVKQLSECRADALISCVRKNRKVDSAFMGFGARSNGRGTAFNVEVDFMVLERGAARDHENHQVQKELQRLWTTSKGVDYESKIGKGHWSHVSDVHGNAMGK